MAMREPTPLGEICTIKELDALRSGRTMLEGMYKMMMVTLNSPIPDFSYLFQWLEGSCDAYSSDKNIKITPIETPYDDFLMKLTTELLADEMGGLTHREDA